MSAGVLLDEKRVESSCFAEGRLMKGRLRQLAWLTVLVAPLWASAASAVTYLHRNDVPSARSVPLDKIDERYRELVRQVLDKPMLSGRGPSETFNCRPEHYCWFLDHPDRAVVAWRRLGAKCVSINPRGDGKFSWADDTGSEVVWETVYKGPGVRVWFADGKVRPGPLLPLVPVKAVVVLRHKDSRAPDGASVMQHQCDLFVHTDSKTAAMMTRMLGPTANRVAEQGLGQLQLFFSGISWYLDRHPEQAEALLKIGD
jgi:hypothetical protein